MKKILLVLSLFITALAYSQTPHVNQLHDSTAISNGLSVSGSITLSKGAAAGKVLTSDTAGHATWQPAGGGGGGPAGSFQDIQVNNGSGGFYADGLGTYYNGNMYVGTSLGIGTTTPNGALQLTIDYHNAGKNAFTIYQSEYQDTVFKVVPKGNTTISAYNNYSGAPPALTVNQNGNLSSSAMVVNQNSSSNGGPGLIINQSNTSQPAIKLVDGTQASGRVLVSDAYGNASWQNPGVQYSDTTSLIATQGWVENNSLNAFNNYVVDSLPNASGTTTISPAVNKTYVLVGGGALGNVVINFPVGVTGNIIGVSCSAAHFGLTLSGSNYSLITAAKITSISGTGTAGTGVTVYFYNKNGNWY